MKKLLLALALALAPLPAAAQCNGVFPPSTLCGNLGATPALPAPFPASGTVVGPVTTVVGHFATWANVTGTQLADFDLFGTGNSWTGAQAFTNFSGAMTSGSVNNAAIGGSTPAAGAFTTLAASGDFAIATNKFTVASASGNTVVAGTLAATGAITSSASIAATTTVSATTTVTGTTGVGGGGAPSGAWLHAAAAGTTSVAPLKFTSGTNLTTATAGAFEYDGSVFYATSVANSRQGLVAAQYQVLAADQSAATGTGTQVWFVGGGPTGVTLASSTAYQFEGSLMVTNGTSSSHTINLGFGGTATLASIAYTAQGVVVGVNTAAGGTTAFVTTASATAVTAAGNQAGGVVNVSGVVRVTTGGTFIPQFAFSANPGGTPLVLANTFFRIWPIGSSSVTTVGNWN